MVLAVSAFVMIFDPNTQKDRIVEAVRRATGRELVLAGPLRLSLGWVPETGGGGRRAVQPGGRVASADGDGGAAAGERGADAAAVRAGSKSRASRWTARTSLLETGCAGRSAIVLFQRPEAAVRDPSGGLAQAAAPSSPHAGEWTWRCSALVVLNGRVTWRNEATGRVHRGGCGAGGADHEPGGGAPGG